jgi:hypothetical protein
MTKAQDNHCGTLSMTNVKACALFHCISGNKCVPFQVSKRGREKNTFKCLD